MGRRADSWTAVQKRRIQKVNNFNNDNNARICECAWVTNWKYLNGER